jgi:glycosyltransferase involved in cell wall biosynthesis
VLYIDGVGPFGGASRSLFEAVGALPQGAVEPLFVAARGTANDFYRKVARDMVVTRGLTRFDNTAYSHYRGMRWLVLGRELFHAPFTVAALRKARRRWPKVDLVHVNEVTEIVPGLMAQRMFGVPLVVHVRSPQWQDTRAARTRWLHARLRDSVDAVIAINETTRATLPGDIRVTVIRNSFTPKAAPMPDTRMLAKLDGLRSGSLKVGFVGNLHLSKGILELIDAAGLVRSAGRDVEFVVVGGATGAGKGIGAWLLDRAGLHQDVLGVVSDRIRAAGVEDSFHLLGPTADIQTVYERLDVVAFPSYFDAPGRPVFEAAFSGVPSIVATAKPASDTLVDGETGVAIARPDPRLLADAIIGFADDRGSVRRMGENARRLAQANFVPRINSAKLLALYRDVLSGSGR